MLNAVPKLGENRRGNAGKGRPKGSLNRATVDVRALAQKYGSDALKTLAKIMGNDGEPAAARVSAAKEILDRAYGKSPQPIEAQGFENANDLLAAIASKLKA